MARRFCAGAAAALCALPVVAAAYPPLPALPGGVSSVSVSGISSGADMAAIFAVAHSDILLGSAIFAGQPPGCATQFFEGEPLMTCAEQVAQKQNLGPGCAGFPGMAECTGCAPAAPPNVSTILYDHCKKPAWPQGPGWVDVSVLASNTQSAAAAGRVAPTSGLASHRTFLYRGTEDTVYLDGSVNKTADFFRSFLSGGSAPDAVYFEASVPSAHCWPTGDPWLPTSTCGSGSRPWAPPAMQNCGGYDGAGAALQHIYANTLVAPPSLVFSRPDRLFQFDQGPYETAAWPGLGSYGYVYVPEACAPPAAASPAFASASSSSSSSGAGGAQPCRVHVALHGCGMSVFSPQMNTSFVQHTGLNPWGDANNIVILYPQGGGFIERGQVAPTEQMQGGCFDGYGQTGADYAFQSGLQVASIRAMIGALRGE